MSIIKTGGSAFPIIHTDSNDQIDSYGGMTLRDYFAARAMQCILENFGAGTEPSFRIFDTGESYAEVTARFAYEYADAMIVERDKEE